MNAPVTGLRDTLVPPTATTFAETDGHSVPGLSPVDAKYCARALRNYDYHAWQFCPPYPGFDRPNSRRAMSVLGRSTAR